MGAPTPLSIIRGQSPWMIVHAQPWEWQDMPSSAAVAKRLGVPAYFTGRFCDNGHRAYRLVSTYGCAMCAAVKRTTITPGLRDRQRNSCRLWRLNNLERERARERQWSRDNLERSRARARLYQKENAKSVCASVLARSKHVRQATPPWADMKAIRQFYANRPEGFHVDHIVPLRGRNVCGLHILENLQYLSAEDNLAKGNRFDA